MNLTDEDRIRCNECLKKLYQTKLLCIQSIQYLIEQQNEIDECIDDLKSTKNHAQNINKNVSQLNDISCLKYCCCNFNQKQQIIETNFNEQNQQLLILPFLHEQSNRKGSVYDLQEFDLEKLFNSIQNSYSNFLTKDDFENILHEEYTILFELAKKLTKSIQILHDTIEFLGADIKLTLDHLQIAQPRMKQLLKIKAPLAFAQIQKDSIT